MSNAKRVFRIHNWESVVRYTFFFLCVIACVLSMSTQKAYAIGDGTAGNPFTDLYSAHIASQEGGFTAGTYNFDIGGNTFSSYMDTDGYVAVASADNTETNDAAGYTEVTALTLNSDDILDRAILAAVNPDELRISVTGATVMDRATTDNRFIARLKAFEVLSQAVGDGTATLWPGTGGAMNPLSAPTVRDLNEKIWHASSSGSSLHWFPDGNPGASAQHDGFGSTLNTSEPTLWMRDTTPPIAPGGVAGDLGLWLKADSENYADADAVPSWTNQIPGYVSDVTASGSAQPDFRVDAINFNPAVDFDGSADRLENATPSISNGAELNVFTVSVDDARDTSILFNFGDNANRISVYPWTDGRLYFDVDSAATGRVFGTQPHGVGEPSLNLSRNSVSNSIQEIVIDGEQLAQKTAGIQSQAGLTTYIGGDDLHNHNGKIAEVVAYDTDLSSVEREQVQSYLALKYGITLGQAAPTDYLASDDSVTMWDSAVAGSFDHDIFGIGRDDASALGQVKSQSVNADAIITLEADGEGTNTTNTFADIDDLEFLTIANDNDDNGVIEVQAAELTPAYDSRLDREWKIYEEGDVGDVDLDFDLGGLGFTAADTITLLIDGNADFSESLTQEIVASSWDGTTATFDGVSIGAGEFFTVARTAAIVAGPGGVSGDLTLWLDADDASTLYQETTCANLATAGQGVGCWLDKSGQGNHVTGTAEPTVVSAALNGKNTLDFAADSLITPDGDQITSNTGYTKFAVVKFDGNGSNNIISSSPGSHAFWGNGGTQIAIWHAGTFINSGNLGATNYQIGTGRYGSPSDSVDSIINVNGTEADRDTSTRNFTAGTTTRIGSHGAGNNLNGQLAEAIVFDRALTDDEIDDVECYLAGKWDIEVTSGCQIETDVTALTVPENGGANTFTTVLGEQPATDVVLNIVSADTGEATVSPATMTFTNANWDTPQTVTVTGVDDSDIGDDTTNIVIAVDDALSDNDFDAAPDVSVAITLISDEAIPGPGGVGAGLGLWIKANTDTSCDTDGCAVDTWTDQSSHGFVGTTGAAKPFYSENEFNYNPTVSINAGGARQEVTFPLSGLDETAFTRFVAMEYETNSTGYGVFEWFNNNAWYTHFPYFTNRGYYSRRSAPRVNPEFVAGQPAIHTFFDHGNPVDSGQRMLGKQLANFTNGTKGNINGSLRLIEAYSGMPNTNFGEYILFDRELSDTETRQVESYLALKYGMTLDQDTATDYLASDGTTLTWNSGVNTNFKYDIAGIGQDNIAEFDQRISQSINDDALVTIATSNDSFSPNSDSARTSLGDGNFLTWSNNDALATVWTATGAPTDREILPRTWQIQETGVVGDVNIFVSDNAVTGTALPEENGSVYLFTDADGDFTSGATEIELTLNGNKWELPAGVDFTDGHYFTFATVPVDVFRPDVAIEQKTGQSDPTNVVPVVFSITFSEPIDPATFTATDIDLSSSTAAGASVSAITEIAPNDATRYEVTITVPVDGDVIATMAADSVKDLVGNGNTTSSSVDNSITVDTTPPTLTPPPAQPTAPATVASPTLTTGSCGIDAANGSVRFATTPTGGLDPATQDFPLNASGDYSITLLWAQSADGNVYSLDVTCIDNVGNPGPTTSVSPITVDLTQPGVSVEQAATQADPTSIDSAQYIATFSEPINPATFAISDIVLSGTTGTITSLLTTIDNQTWSFDITGMTSGDTVIATIPVGLVEDAAGNTNLASVSGDNEVTYDVTPPGAPTNPLDLINSSDTGSSNTDDLTSDNSPTFDVICTIAGEVIAIYSDLPAADTAVATHVCVGAAAEQVTVSPTISDGVHNISYTYTDSAGNESLQSVALPVTVDTAPPATPTINSPTLGLPPQVFPVVDINVDCEIVGDTITIYGPGITPDPTVHVCTSVGPVDIPVTLTTGGGVNLTVTTTDPSGNESPGTPVNFTAGTATDNDGDGNDNSTEDAGANGGDGNGDGIQDSLQQSVSGAPNPVTGEYTTLVASGDCTFITENAFVTEGSLVAEDPTFDYPVGLTDFQVQCANPGDSTTVTLYYAQEYDTSSWSYKKYDSNGSVYSDISDIVTFGTATVGTADVTTVTFTATDGDPETDEDGVADGLINDPSGPAVSSTVPIYRFYSETYNSHFYTKSDSERALVIAAYDDSIWRYEGIAFYAYPQFQAGYLGVHRFWNDTDRAHFYTTNTAEQALIDADPNWRYEGVDWYASTVGPTVYRFYSENYKSHFYTTSVTERDAIVANDLNWILEGEVKITSL